MSSCYREKTFLFIGLQPQPSPFTSAICLCCEKFADCVQCLQMNTVPVKITLNTKMHLKVKEATNKHNTTD